jgi:tyrosinase
MINVDSPDFYHSNLLNPSPKSGFGGWGDPNNDFQISDGAFHSDFIVSYPVPHIVRRNFTLQPWLGDNTTVFEDGSTSIFYDSDIMANVSITPESQYNMVHGFVADYEGFQALMEGTNVKSIDHSLLIQFTQL